MQRYINISDINIPMEFDVINEILELNEKIKENVPEKRRFYYKYLNSAMRPFLGIAGLKGAGKTVMLRQYLTTHPNTIYISLDSIEIPNLFEIAKYLSEERKIKTILLDEVHFYPNWKRDLKKIYDFLNVNVIYTSSVSMDIFSSRVDLSRRTITKEVYPFSLREYIYFTNDKNIKKLKIEDIDNNKVMQEIAQYDFLFNKYIEGGLLPAFLNQSNTDIFRNIALSVIGRDLPRTEKWTTEDISNVKNMLKFMATSKIDDISYSSISRNIGITKYKAEKYTSALEKSFILNVIEPKGTNITKEPKILFMPPFREAFSKNKEYDMGAKREEFFVMSMKMLKIPIFYLKGKRGEKIPDYLINLNGNNYIFEIGGKNKGITQLKINIKAKKYLLTNPSSIDKIRKPLIFAGFII